MNRAVTIAFGLCFTLALGLIARGQQISGGGGSSTPGGATTQVQFNDSGAFNGNSKILINKTNNTLAFGGITSSFGSISGSCTQCLATNRVGIRLADDSSFATVATNGVDYMQGTGGNRQGYIDSGGNGLRLGADNGTGIDLLAPASSGGGSNGIHFSGAHVDVNYSFQTPATGFTITLGNNIWHTVLDPAGTLATGTITMPALPGDGMIINVRSSQIVTALTVSPNTAQSIKGAPSAFAVGGTFECIYNGNNTTWYC